MVDDILGPIVVSAATAIATLVWRFGTGKNDTRTWSDLIRDMRAMNEYNAHLIAAIVIFLGFAVVEARSLVTPTALKMLLIAFTSGALSMFFFPLRKPSESEEEHPRGTVQAYWVFDMVASQTTVVFAVFGMWTIIAHAAFTRSG